MLVMSSGSSQGYSLLRSLRFRRSNSAYLSRNPSSTTNRRTWTWSAWLKLGDLSQATSLFYKHGTTDADYFRIGYGIVTAGRLYISAFNGATFGVEPSATLRDASAWYHIVVTVDTTQATAANRCKVSINGINQTVFSVANYPAQNFDTAINTNAAHEIGRINFSNTYDGLMTEVNFIDGQALTSTSFGEIDSITGVWKPKKYTGSYGTNGFYLPFTDNSVLTTASNVGLGRDYSGNGNYWVTNNISITSGSTYDSFTDVPTLTSSTAANYCSLNYNDSAAGTCSDANLRFVATSASNTPIRGTIFVNSGKWYWEVFGANNVGIANHLFVCATSRYPGDDANGYAANRTAVKYPGGAAYGAGWVANGTEIIGVAFDCNAGTLEFFKNGVSQGVAFTGIVGTFAPCSTAWNGSDTVNANFGQRPFAYTPPNGFLPLNTANLPVPAIFQGSKHFDTVTRNGFGASGGSVSSLGFQPDLIWDKTRNIVSGHYMSDSTRGINNQLRVDSTVAETNSTNWFTAFNSNGFSVGSSDHLVTTTAVDWCWKKGATPGFDIVAYTGTGINRTVAHSLGVAPSMMIVKNRSGNFSWAIYHASVGATKVLQFDTLAATTDSTSFNNTAPTSSVFTVGTAGSLNQNTGLFIAYLWAEINGFSRINSYVGNGSADGPFVYCGFRPRFVMIKRTDTTADWVIHDTARDSFNVSASDLYPHLSSAESAASSLNIDFLSNGLKIRSTLFNASGGSYIFAAFAENPFKHSLAR